MLKVRAPEGGHGLVWCLCYSQLPDLLLGGYEDACSSMYIGDGEFIPPVESRMCGSGF